jgi:uncharacterized protein (TIGR02646 family)
MQYIQKQNQEPGDWSSWFTVPPNKRSFDYKADNSSMRNLRLAKSFLIEEQKGLCAYCQQTITVDNSSIEHVTAKEFNLELSTSYFNLVAVCKKNQIRDTYSREGKYHCDTSRGSNILPPIIFYSSAKSTTNNLNKFFKAYSDGSLVANHNLDPSIKMQVDAFIEILNLNHSNLMKKRGRDTLNGIIEASKSVTNKKSFWKSKYQSILNNPYQQFREYLLVYIGSKLGMN